MLCTDIVLEHPSSSRLHAVLQFNGETRAAYLYDANSAHGTFVNRRRIKAGVHVPIRYPGAGEKTCTSHEAQQQQQTMQCCTANWVRLLCSFHLLRVGGRQGGAASAATCSRAWSLGTSAARPPSACCRVGDMIKFGQSTRDWLLCGPAELMPEEGPSKTQRLEARLLKVPPTGCT